MQGCPGILLIGKRAAGKTTLIKEIIKSGCVDEIAAVVSGGAEFTPEYNDVVGRDCIHKDRAVEVINQVIRLQRECPKKRGLVLDCCMHEPGFVRSNAFRGLVMNHQCYQIPYVLAIQFPMILTPDIRNNIDYVFMFKDSNEQNKQQLYRHWGYAFNSYEDFDEAFIKHTSDRGCLVIDLTSRSSKLEDRVFWFNAFEPRP